MTISKNSIIRLSKYRKALQRFKKLSLIKVFSTNIAESVGVTSIQVRKDFSIFNINGKKKGGYVINELLFELNKILGKDEIHSIIIVGDGKIGQALTHYPGFEKDSFRIVAVFDSDPQKTDKKAKIPIFHTDDMIPFISKHKIKYAMITVPESSAQNVLDLLVISGIKGVLNFAPIQLRHPGYMVIGNVNIVLELENVVYFSKVLELYGQPTVKIQDRPKQIALYCPKPLVEK